MSMPSDLFPRKWKGKQREREVNLESRSEGNGGSDGIVIPMIMTGDGTWSVEYTVPITVGDNQNLSLQVDTGSSDLWIASTSCSSSACSSTHLYNPSDATQTGETFNIAYLLGGASGPIVWDSVKLGGYSILNQALAAASSLTSEPLSSSFSGILGLALPANSVIESELPSSTSDAPDGATFSSNLFSITPSSQAPPSRFLSLSLERPGSDRTPSLLGIGRHPEELVSDPSKIGYTSLVASAEGGLRFWQTSIQEITVYDNGEAKSTNIGRSHTGAAFPIAVVDSGVPYILTTSWIANGIYGAIGISPSSDGNYYVPCTTPLNMTITLAGIGDLPLHPLDLTAEPLQDSTSSNCVGLIQQADALLAPNEDIADMILGVPFMRNMYTVLAYDMPDSSGAFPSSGSASSNPNSITPRLGLMALTNASLAMEEFHTVRVLNQPLSPSSGSSSSGNTSSSPSKKGLSIGLDVLIGLAAFFGLCAILFVLRWVLGRRKWRQTHPLSVPEGGVDTKSYALAPLGREDEYGPSEDELRTLRYEAYKRNRRVQSDYSTSSTVTKVDGEPFEGEGQGEGGLKDIEMGFRPSFHDPWDPHTSIAFDWRDTLVGEDSQHKKHFSKDDSGSPSPSPSLNLSPEMHRRNLSEDPPITAPLLAHMRTSSQGSQNGDLVEMGVGGGDRTSMAGIGTAARGSRIEHGLSDSTGSIGTVASFDLGMPGPGLSLTQTQSRVNASVPLRPSPLGGSRAAHAGEEESTEL